MFAATNIFTYRGYIYDIETGFYYLGSRYYDPTTGRFLNADGITDGGAGVLGNNLYLYSANNPINNIDPSGNAVVRVDFKSGLQWFMKNIAKPVVDFAKEATPLFGNATRSAELSISGSIGISVGGSVGVAYDYHGNIGFTGSYFIGGGSTSGSLTYSGTVSTAKTIDKLKGNSYVGGGSLGPVVAEYQYFTDANTNEPYHALSLGYGIGAPAAEIHGGQITTDLIYLNVYDEFDSLYIKIMEW